MPDQTMAAPLGRHFVQFYRHDAPLLDEVADFIESGLRCGDAGVVIATAAHRAALDARLRLAFGADLASCPGEFIALDAAQTLERFMVEGWPDAQRFMDTMGRVVEEASARGTRSVCAFGEMVALLCEQNRHEAAVQLEQLWDELLRHQPVSLFCAYPLDLFSQARHARMFEHVCTHHTHVLPPELRLEDAGSERHDLALAQLQHKAVVLEAEVARRRQAEQTLRRREQELAELLERLQSASRTKDEFLAMLGHELRNPLAPIVTALQLMKMRGDGQTTREQGIIQRQVDHLIRLVDDLLDVSKITRGKIELRREQVEIGDVLKQAIEMASVLLEQRQHRLVTHVPSSGLRCIGDPVRLAQVVTNLLINAARYTPPGGEIRLTAFRDTGHVVISVQDTGRGIAPHMLSRVFELFVQGQRGVDRAEGGLGIGLSLVKSLVGLHGGTVRAHSDGPGRGSEFVVRLPSASDELPMPERPQAASRASPERSGKQVLLVDDNVDAAEMLGMVLRERGHDVRVVHDPVAALKAVASFRPAVAVLDIGLPAMDGYELAARLRAELGDGTCRLIALTGYGQEADRARSKQAGFEVHLVKPVDVARLSALVDARTTPQIGV